MYFVGEINKHNGSKYNRIFEAPDLECAYDQVKNYVKYQTANYYAGIYNGVFTVRPATTQEAIEDLLKDFAGNWNEYNISEVAKEIIEIVKGDGSQ